MPRSRATCGRLAAADGTEQYIRKHKGSVVTVTSGMSRWVQWGLALLGLSVVLLVFWPGISGGFIFDDLGAIVDNKRLHAGSMDPAVLWRSAMSFDPGGTFGARPLPMLSFAINHALGGLDPWGYKLGGVLVHLVNVMLLFGLLRCLLRAPILGMQQRQAIIVAALMSLLWAIHPIQVSSVLYVVQRMETMAATFMLGALWSWLHGRLRQIGGRNGLPWLVGSAFLTLAGLLCKETAVLVPVFALALELTVLKFGARTPVQEVWWRRVCVGGTVFALLIFIAVVAPHYWYAQYPTRDFGTGERLLTQLRVLPLYVWQMAVPTPGNLVFYYDQIAPSRGWLSPVSTLIGAFSIAAILVSAFVARRHAPLYALGVLWFFAAHLLTSNVPGLELAFEHRNYLALLGVMLAVFDLLRRLPVYRSPLLQVVSISALVVATAGFTLIRSATWGDSFLLATDLVLENPQSARASADLAAHYLEMSDGNPRSPFTDMAIAEFERGAGLPRSSIVSDQGLIIVSGHAGREVKDLWWRNLILKVRYGTLSPETTGAMFGLLGSRYKGVPLDDHRLTQAFRALFDRATLPPHSYAQVGDYALTYAGDEEFADEMFVKAIAESGAHPDYARTVVERLQEKGWRRQAALAVHQAHSMGILKDVSAEGVE